MIRRAILSATFLIVGLSTTVLAEQVRKPEYLPPTIASNSPVVTIENNYGGYVDLFIEQVEELRRKGTKVRIAGACDSACTLYLSLPKSQVCVYGNTKFGFHKPYGSKADHLWEKKMMSMYPKWVRNWIKQKGGLSKHMKYMSPNYHAKHLNRCA